VSAIAIGSPRSRLGGQTEQSVDESPYRDDHEQHAEHRDVIAGAIDTGNDERAAHGFGRHGPPSYGEGGACETPCRANFDVHAASTRVPPAGDSRPL
jgi:hypothetical protein